MTENLPIYQWDPWPEGMFTARQLREKGLVPGPVAGLIPYSKSADGDGYLRVYRLDEATPKPPLSEARQAAVERMRAAQVAARTCTECGRVVPTKHDLSDGLCEICALETARTLARKDAVEWARQIVAENDYVVLDTATTGLSDRSEVIAISVLAPDGTVLLDSYVKPQVPIVEEVYEFYEDEWHGYDNRFMTAFGIHGISNAMVADAPAWPAVAEQLRSLLSGKTVVCYNEAFDHQVINSNCARHDVPKIKARRWECLMLAYAEWAGDWSDHYEGWLWWPLTTAAKTFNIQRGEARAAVGDSLTALGVLKAMAEAGRDGQAEG